MFLYFSDGAVRSGAELAGTPAVPAVAGRDGFSEYVGRFPSVLRHNTPDCQRQMWEVRPHPNSLSSLWTSCLDILRMSGHS